MDKKVKVPIVALIMLILLIVTGIIVDIVKTGFSSGMILTILSIVLLVSHISADLYQKLNLLSTESKTLRKALGKLAKKWHRQCGLPGGASVMHQDMNIMADNARKDCARDIEDLLGE